MIILIIIILGLVWLIVALLKKEAKKGKEEVVKEAPWPYRVKDYFFTRSEQMFLDVLRRSINTERYAIYPKGKIGTVTIVYIIRSKIAYLR